MELVTKQGCHLHRVEIARQMCNSSFMEPHGPAIIHVEASFFALLSCGGGTHSSGVPQRGTGAHPHESHKTSNHWIGFKLAGHKSNRDGIGAVIRIETSHGSQWYTVTTSSAIRRRVTFARISEPAVTQ